MRSVCDGVCIIMCVCKISCLRERVCVFEDMCVMGCERGCEVRVCEKSYVGVRVFEDVCEDVY